MRCLATEPEDLVARRRHRVAQGGTKCPEFASRGPRIFPGDLSEYDTDLWDLSVYSGGIVQPGYPNGSSVNLLSRS